MDKACCDLQPVEYHLARAPNDPATVQECDCFWTLPPSMSQTTCSVCCYADENAALSEMIRITSVSCQETTPNLLDFSACFIQFQCGPRDLFGWQSLFF